MDRKWLMKKISDQADEVARQWNKTRDPKFKTLWYSLIRQASSLVRSQSDK